MWPGFFRIDEIRGQGGHAAPVINASIEQLVIIRRGEIWWRLDVDFRHEKARQGNAPKHFATARLRAIVHWDIWLSPEVLLDHVWYMAVTAMQFTNRQQRIHPIFCGLADPNQQSLRARDSLFAGFVDGTQA